LGCGENVKPGKKCERKLKGKKSCGPKTKKKGEKDSRGKRKWGVQKLR